MTSNPQDFMCEAAVFNGSQCKTQCARCRDYGHKPEGQKEHDRLLKEGWRLGADGCYRKPDCD